MLKTNNYILAPAVGIIIISLYFLCYPFLYLPYYWDEMWVYGPALRMMADSGPSLLPNTIDVYWTKGHPLLFHFLGSSFLKLFGNTIFNSHLYAFIISSSLITSTVFITFKLSKNTFLSIAAGLLLVCNSLFWEHITIVLPETLLALCVLWALYFYATKNYLAYLLFASLAILTKETGIVVPIAASIHILLSSKLDRATIANTLKYAIPLFVLILFWAIQYQYTGWILFPDHQDRMNFSHEYINYIFKLIIDIMFVNEYKLAYVLLGVGMFIFDNEKLKLVYIKVALALIFLNSIFWLITNTWFDWVSVLYIYLSIVLFIQVKKIEIKDRFISLYILFLLFFILFCCVNFFTNRYIIVVFAPLIISLCISANNLAQRVAPKVVNIVYVLFATAFLAQAFNLVYKSYNAEKTSYQNHVHTFQKLSQALVDSNFQKNKVYAHFLTSNALNIPLAGYNNSDSIFEKIVYLYNPSDSTEVFALNSIEDEEVKLELDKRNDVVQIFFYAEKKAWTAIYKRKNSTSFKTN